MYYGLHEKYLVYYFQMYLIAQIHNEIFNF